MSDRENRDECIVRDPQGQAHTSGESDKPHFLCPSVAQRPTQSPVCFFDLADHHGARSRLARQVSRPAGEIRAVTLPFTIARLPRGEDPRDREGALAAGRE